MRLYYSTKQLLLDKAYTSIGEHQYNKSGYDVYTCFNWRLKAKILYRVDEKTGRTTVLKVDIV